MGAGGANHAATTCRAWFRESLRDLERRGGRFGGFGRCRAQIESARSSVSRVSGRVRGYIRRRRRLRHGLDRRRYNRRTRHWRRRVCRRSRWGWHGRGRLNRWRVAGRFIRWRVAGRFIRRHVCRRLIRRGRSRRGAAGRWCGRFGLRGRRDRTTCRLGGFFCLRGILRSRLLLRLWLIGHIQNVNGDSFTNLNLLYWYGYVFRKLRIACR